MPDIAGADHRFVGPDPLLAAGAVSFNRTPLATPFSTIISSTGQHVRATTPWAMAQRQQRMEVAVDVAARATGLGMNGGVTAMTLHSAGTACPSWCPKAPDTAAV